MMMAALATFPSLTGRLQVPLPVPVALSTSSTALTGRLTGSWQYSYYDHWNTGSTNWQDVTTGNFKLNATGTGTIGSATAAYTSILLA